MESKTQQGYLVLADISGYTSFLASTELDHAHEILSELLELIVHTFSPMLTLSKLEGDAVFAYAPVSRVTRGETLLELLEVTYANFRDRLVAMHRRTTCTCSACRGIPKLDLKFMAHYGNYILQNVANNVEVIGSDVNLVHRLLKNHVVENSGWKAYGLFTEQALQQMCVLPENMFEDTENYEHLGDVHTHSLNLMESYKRLADERTKLVTTKDASGEISFTVPAAIPVAWEWMNDPHKRNLYSEGKHFTIVARPSGRTAAGARNHCAHGKNSGVVEHIVDWRPFKYYTSEYAMFASVKMFLTTEFEPVDDNTTRVTVRMQFTSMPKFVARMMATMFLKDYEKSNVAMTQCIKEAEKQVDEAPQIAQSTPEPAAV